MKIVAGMAMGFETYIDACKDSLLQMYFEIRRELLRSRVILVE